MNSKNSIHDKKTDLRAPQRNPQQGDRKYQQGDLELRVPST